jgi:two-component system response regulator LytT
MLRALVVDDEAPARSELRFLLDEAGGVEVVGEASNAVEALQLIRAIPYDAIFLDIDMPGLSGMHLADVLSNLERAPAIIFVTAHSEHAVQAFEVAAVDYLVKPVELDRLRQAIGRVSGTEVGTKIERIPVEKAGRKILLSVEDIFYIMAKDDYSYLFTGSERYLSTMSLAQLEPISSFRSACAGLFVTIAGLPTRWVRPAALLAAPPSAMSSLAPARNADTW